ncbi:30S ribosomal protein S3 [candidate division WWE3 bacterium CG_4_9_14_3_um_filter_34_6]|uniref:Small ribosomal subunit protein uS3 n=1 Tax=candidate division WWE3 bacterium CG_4_9_14_3_um_filter_34_6 TaxID=1975079 RepID=A0A2M7X3A8_UNCKA|nr:MAG: 30S ribosomal protein S3 [candidate division WWE3 bacterium CG_4_9_14_3_um_filter_34_6]
MSRKVNANGFRIGITKNWKSLWFAEGDRYADRVVEDDKIRSYLDKSLRSAGLAEIIIERSIKAVKLIIRVARPGVVIGRKGSGLSIIREEIKKITESEIDLQIEEVLKPETNAKVIADSIAMQIERRVHARRAMSMAAEKAIDAGVKGVKIQIRGTVHGPNSIATVDVASRGAVPTQTLRADIDFARSIAYTRGGTIGIKVWVNKGEVDILNVFKV